ncbi:MAG: type II toxin-antitoxin system RelE/ParE family toxin [Patescibacteria group bacterium]
MEVKFFDNTIEVFISNLEKLTIAKILRTIDLLERFGPQLGMPHSKKIGDKIFELRVRGKQEVRLFYTFYKNNAVILCGFIKKSQKIPQREILAARQKLTGLDKV